MILLNSFLSEKEQTLVPHAGDQVNKHYKAIIYISPSFGV